MKQLIFLAVTLFAFNSLATELVIRKPVGPTYIEVVSEFQSSGCSGSETALVVIFSPELNTYIATHDLTPKAGSELTSDPFNFDPSGLFCEAIVTHRTKAGFQLLGPEARIVTLQFPGISSQTPKVTYQKVTVKKPRN